VNDAARESARLGTLVGKNDLPDSTRDGGARAAAGDRDLRLAAARAAPTRGAGRIERERRARRMRARAWFRRVVIAVRERIERQRAEQEPE